MIYLLTAVA